jgi:hypothetical protein
MAKVRVFQNADGSVRILSVNDRHRLAGETDAQYFARETVKAESVQPGLSTLPSTDMDASSLPASPRDQHKWRVVGNRVVVDLAVPDLLHPRQALLDELNAALSMRDLQFVLAKVIRG